MTGQNRPTSTRPLRSPAAALWCGVVEQAAGRLEATYERHLAAEGGRSRTSDARDGRRGQMLRALILQRNGDAAHAEAVIRTSWDPEAWQQLLHVCDRSAWATSMMRCR